jgi:class 3 adenylate cyclase
MPGIKDSSGTEELLLKIGIHEGPCLAVTLNDRLDYFGQTVNIAARVQGLAMSTSIFATGSVVEHPISSRLLVTEGLTPRRSARRCAASPTRSWSTRFLEHVATAIQAGRRRHRHSCSGASVIAGT